MTRNEMLRVSVRCEHVPPLKPQHSIINTSPPSPPQSENSSDGCFHSKHKYLYIDMLEGIFILMYPAVQSFWTDGPGINACPLMFGGLHYVYSQIPTLHHPHLETLKYVNRNSLLHNISVYCQLRYTATNRGEQIITLYRGLNELYKIGKIGVLQCLSFLIFSFHLSIKYTMISSPLPLAAFDGATTNARQKVT